MDTSFRMAFDSTYRQYDENAFAQLGNRPEELKVNNPDQKLGIEYFEQYVEEAVRVAEERNVALYCGEYGVIDNASPEDALKWYTAITSCFDKYNIGRAAWSYREMDFGIVDSRMDSVRDDILKVV